MAIADPRQDIEQVRVLLEQYFDLGSHESDAAVATWLQQYELLWIRSAIVEALYQGRYKVLSVDHILSLWGRRGQPLRHYNREFEAIISGQRMLFPRSLAARGKPEPLTFTVAAQETLRDQPSASASDQVNPFLQKPSESWSDAPRPVEKPWFAAPSLEKAAGAMQPSSAASPETALPEGETSPSKVDVEAPGIKPFEPWVTLQPKPGAWLGSPVDMSVGHPEPIQTFVPEVSSADLDQRLQSVARKSERSS